MELADIERASLSDPENVLHAIRLEQAKSRAGLPTLSWFGFDQNNSGGYYRGPKFIAVQAKDAVEANKRAVESGEIYFNGVYDEIDCDCCGDRWYEVEEDEASPEPTRFDERVEPSPSVMWIFSNGAKVGGEEKDEP